MPCPMLGRWPRCWKKLSRSPGQFEGLVSGALAGRGPQHRHNRTCIEKHGHQAKHADNVLSILAGQEVIPRRSNGAAAERLAEALPEDLVLITFSTHGYNGADGQFYLFPSGIGRAGQAVDKALLQRAISTDSCRCGCGTSMRARWS